MTFTFKKTAKKQQKNSKKTAKSCNKTAKKAAKKQQKNSNKTAKSCKKTAKSSKSSKTTTSISNKNDLIYYHDKFCLAFFKIFSKYLTLLILPISSNELGNLSLSKEIISFLLAEPYSFYIFNY
ncbi:MAG: hypothetical protein L6V78_05710 [Clostridium sp.]|nr:MAG: hypothetical protein L6V78_05710 [Clostridium sp.]